MSAAHAPGAIILSRPLTGLATARCLGKANIRAHALLFERGDGARWSRYCSSEDIPEDTGGEDAIVERIIELGKLDGERPVVFPCSDAQALLLARNLSRLLPFVRCFSTPSDILTGIVSKDGLYRLAGQAGVPTIEAIVAPGVAQLAQWSAQHEGPYFLKPYYAGIRATALPRKNHVLHSRAELLAFVAQHGSEALIVQQLVLGGDGHVFDVYGACDCDGRVMGLASHRRWRQEPPDRGVTSYGEIPAGIDALEEAELFAMTRRLLAGTRYHGIFGIEWLRDRRTGDFYLIDFNARPFTSIAHLQFSGLNLPALAYRELVEGASAGTSPEPRIARSLWVDFLSDSSVFLERRTRGELTLLAWLGSLARARSYAYLDWRDPLPALQRGFETVARALRHFTRRLARHAHTPSP